MKTKNIETTVHGTWEDKGLRVVTLENEIKQRTEESTEIKTGLKDELASQRIDVYQGREVILTRRISPIQYGVSFEVATKYATLTELAEVGALNVDLKPFEELMTRKNITLVPEEYLELRKPTEYLIARKK
jgi:hypothetical protein